MLSSEAHEGRDSRSKWTCKTPWRHLKERFGSINPNSSSFEALDRASNHSAKANTSLVSKQGSRNFHSRPPNATCPAMMSQLESYGTPTSCGNWSTTLRRYRLLGAALRRSSGRGLSGVARAKRKRGQTVTFGEIRIRRCRETRCLSILGEEIAQMRLRSNPAGLILDRCLRSRKSHSGNIEGDGTDLVNC